jgi:hypothetical protein
MITTDNLIKSYSDRTYKHTTMVRHKGTVVALAMDDQRRIYYSVLALDNTEKGKSPLDVHYWLENPKPLNFCHEIVQVGYGIVDPTAMPIVKKGSRAEAEPGTLRPEEIDPFLSTTARFTADAPFQALSDGKYIYIFRQSIDSNHSDMVYARKRDGSAVVDQNGNKVPVVNETLLVDRFVLAGTQLQPKMEVRYKRSRNKYRGHSNKDSLGAQDMEKKPFFEPTQELDFVRNLRDGRFSVLLLPTQVAGIQRWQLFTHNSKTDRIESFNVERSDDGLFNTKGTQFYTSPDPEYQKSVFERQPGTCPFTGQELIPIVTKSGYAESALEFDGQSYITCGSNINLADRSFAVEFWAKRGTIDRQQCIVGQGKSVNNNALLIGFRANNNFFMAFWGNAIDTTSAYTDQNWHHWACSYNHQNKTQELYCDGVLVQTNTTNSDCLATGELLLGCRFDLNERFSGTIDEVRIWNRSRSHDEIKADLNYRLEGNEPGLIGYWQFDEGSGNTIGDRTENGNQGTISGNPQWVKSDAPIGDRSGIGRHSVKFAGRTIESGISAILYYQQENAATGYDQQEKPIKKNARVMLAVATGEEQNPTEKHHIGVLDLAVSREGKLGQIPDNVALPLLSKEGAGGLSTNEALEQISNSEKKIQQLQGDIKQLEGSIQDITENLPGIDLKIGQLDQQIKNLQQEISKTQNLTYNVTTYTGDVSGAGTDANVYVTLKGSLKDSREFVIDNSSNNFERGQWDALGPFNLGEIGSLRQIRIRHDNYGVGPGWYLEKVLIDIYQGSTRLEQMEFPCMRWLARDEDDRQIDRTLSPVSSSSLRDRVQIQRDIDQRTSEQNNLRNQKTELSSLKDRQALSKVNKQKELSEQQKLLMVLRGQLGDAVPMPMSILHIDPLGLTLSGGLLGFAYTKDTPQLFDSATGQLSLYFRGVDDQFFAAYYDTHTQKSQSLLPADTGNLTFVARSAEPEIDESTITVSDGTTPDNCTVKIQNSAIDLTETWDDVPREVEQFTNVINGIASEKVFIGSLGKDVFGIVTSLTVEKPIKYALKPHDILLIGDTQVQVSGAVDRNSTEIAIASATIETAINTSVYLLPYNYAVKASTNKLTASLAYGSLQFFAFPGNAQGKVKNGTATSSGATVSCQWVPQSPGKALAFDGQNDFVGLAKSLAKSNVPAPKSIVNISALQLNGSSDYVSIAIAEPVTEITHELWFKTTKDNVGLFSITADDGGHDRHIYLKNGNIYTRIWSDETIGTTGLNLADGQWHHVAHAIGSSVGGQQIYVDGLLMKSGTKSASNFNWNTKVRVGFSADATSNYLEGQIAEVRIWNCTRTQPEIQANMNQPLQGNESGLIGYWRFEAGIAKDYSGNGRDGTYIGNPQLVAPAPVKLPPALVVDETETLDFTNQLAKLAADGDLTLETWVNPSAVTNATRLIHHHSPNSKYTLGLQPHGEGYACFMGVGSQFKQSQEMLKLGQWEHLALVYGQSYALQFNGSAYLSCDHSPTLDLTQDLTIEAFLQVDDLKQPRGILTKGQLDDGSDRYVPYSLYVDTDGKIAFAFEDKDGNDRIYKSTASITPGQFYKIAVTRLNQTETKNEGTQEKPNVKVNQWADIRFYINQKEQGYFAYHGKDPGGSDRPLELGKTYKGSQEHYFKGILSEVRLYNTALKPENLGSKIQGKEEGLISWWRLEENEGNIAYDAKSTNNATIKGAKWVKNPDPKASALMFYCNGSTVELQDMPQPPAWGEEQFTLGGISNGGLLECFAGTLEEVRIWKVSRTQEQIQDNLFTRLKGEKEYLIANYTFDFDSELDSESQLKDHSLLGNHLTLGSGDSQPTAVISTAPIGDDIAQVRSALGGVKTQFHDAIHSRPTVQEYGDMQYDADGNLIGVHKRCYGYIKNGQWNLLTGYKVGNLVTEWVGQVQANPQIIGYIEGAPPVPSENLTSTSLKLGEFEDYNGCSAVELQEADSVNYIYASSKESGFDTAIDLTVQAGVKSKTLAGVGVVQEVSDVNLLVGGKTTLEYSSSSLSESTVSYGRNTTKTSRLELRGTWEKAGTEINPAVGRRFIPANKGFALVQSDTMDVFALRLAHNNALVSYRMQPNPDIPKDWNIITFPLNQTYTKQGTLDGKVGAKPDGSVQCDPDYPNATTYGQYSYFKPIEAYSLKKRIDREQQELETYYQQYETAAEAAQELAGSDVPKQLSSRNLVNTYVWTADGGFFSESTEVMESVQESTTGSYSFQGMGGVALDTNIAAFGGMIHVEMDALFGGHVETVKTKGKETEKSFGLTVEVAVDSDLQLYVNTDTEREKYAGRINEGGGAYDPQGNPVLRPGKVDAYRFMSFYLEPTKNNFEDFFNKVVDPMWLEQSDAPNAVALRQANQGDQKPKCWRIMHRVTYVSRILPEISAENAPPMEKAMKAANVESNYELIKKLEPFVKNKTQDYAIFADAVRKTLKLYLPELQPHEEDIIKYAGLYFGVEEEL